MWRRACKYNSSFVSQRRHPEPCHRRKTVECVTFVLCSLCLHTQANLGVIMDRLQSLQFKCMYSSKWLSYTIKADAPAALQPKLQALHAIQWSDNSKDMKAYIYLHLKMTHDVMKMLAELPAWPGRIDFRGCTWPLPAAEYNALASHVPTSYTEWRLNIEPTSDVLGATQSMWYLHVCAGINEVRKGLGLPRVKVYLHGFVAPEGGLNELPVGDHVVLVPGSEV